MKLRRFALPKVCGTSFLSSQTSSLAQTLKTWTALNNHNMRKERVLEWKEYKKLVYKITSSLSMRQISICIFVENLVDQKQGKGSKILLPLCRSIIVTIIDTICRKGLIHLTLRKPKAVQKEVIDSKKRRKGRWWNGRCRCKC